MFNAALQKGEGEVTIDERMWVNGSSAEIYEYSRTFNRFIEEKKLKVETIVDPNTSIITLKDFNKRLKLSGQPVSKGWATGSVISTGFAALHELPEFRTGLDLTDD